MKLELVEIRRATKVQESIMDAAGKAVLKSVRAVHGKAAELAPIDTSRLRNNLVWSIDGREYGGSNQFGTTAPESIWGHKKGARPVGAPADMEDASALARFPVNDDPSKVVGYVGSNVKRDGHAPYGAYQEFGWHDKKGNFHIQPFFRPAVYTQGTGREVRPRFLRELKNVKFGPMKIERLKK